MVVDVVHSEVHLKTRQLPIDQYQQVVEPNSKPRPKDHEKLVRRNPVSVRGVPTHRYQVVELSVGAYRDKIKGRVAEHRYSKETAGTSLSDGTKLTTDRNTQSALANLKVSFDAGIVTEVQWKTEGGFITLDATKLNEVITAVTTHVQSVFASEKAACEALDALNTLEELAAYRWKQHF